MNLESSDYTFSGLLSDGKPVNSPITSIAYLIALVETPENPVSNLDKAKQLLRYLFDMEEQVKSAAELLAIQAEIAPKGYFPQTPVMLALRWSPISALLEGGWDPILLTREAKARACASGIWKMMHVENNESHRKPSTSEELFWCVLYEVSQKCRARNQFLSIIAKPGWSYESNDDRPWNFTQAEAQKADRVIWQRTPRKSG